MKELAIIIALLLACSLPACTDAAPDQGKIAISSVSGRLEAGRTGAIMIELENNISFMPPPSGILMAKGSCLDVAAKLQSSDQKISVISEPQLAGSIAPGENRLLEFMASADQDIDVGTYPMELVVSYSRLSDIRSTGSIPDILFEYDDVEETMPLEVKVSLGPIIRLEVGDAASPGAISELVFTFTNTGDETASGLQVQPSQQYPFKPLSSVEDIGTLEPGGSASVGLSVFTENDTDTGYYALPCKISYQSGTIERNDEVSAIVEVKERSWNSTMILAAAAAALLIAAAIYAGIRVRSRRRPRRRSL